MNKNANVIVLLCSHLCVGEGVYPLEPKEWSELAGRLIEKGLEPSDILEFSSKELQDTLQASSDFSERIMRLIDRSGSLAFELSKYENIGIFPITRADREYPAVLKKRLGSGCPPLFYYSGNLRLADIKAIGFAGSRTVSEADISFAWQTVKKTVERGYSVVSGGAKGIDSAAAEASLSMGGYVVEYLSDSMMRKLKQSEVSRSVRDGKRLILSVVKPNAGFNAGVAMMRNRYIYAHSKGTVIVKSDLNKGGTWTGAIDALKHDLCPVLCNKDNKYPGNAELIRQGAIGIDLSWDGDIEKITASVKSEQPTQLSVFDIKEQ